MFPKGWSRLPSQKPARNSFVPSEASTIISPRRKEDQVSPRKDCFLQCSFGWNNTARNGKCSMALQTPRGGQWK
ncbi:hypothetical protein CEXT_512871 [Caerostris extrusa]|uniref:Uncharacterized protein n=1 Tax=Caerostris extrusa TaxID=172846 RepID=A0AAV4XI73_CAEEX|nr:hypothetical protein CEXT_512871 [Caerostris extrusa]